MKLPLRLLAVILPLALTACGDDEPQTAAPASFAPLRYGYLPKLRLNAGTIDVEDHSGSAGNENDIANQAPTPPAQALAQMAHDRLFPAGLNGQATFVIDQASIIRDPNGTLTGHMAVHLDIAGANGAGAHTQAAVARQHVPGSDPENQQSVLNDMTREMMDSMNVELEYQMRHSMAGWLVSDNVLPTKVDITPLQQATPQAASPQATPPAAAEPTIPGVDLAPAPGEQPAQVPPQPMSPPPGFLTLPPGTLPQN